MRRAKNWLKTDDGKKYIQALDQLEEAKDRQKLLYKDFTGWLKSPTIEKDQAYKCIGEFMVKFSHLELLLKLVLSFEAKVNSVLYGAFMQSFDISKTIDLLKYYYEQTLAKNPELLNKMMKSLNECHNINQTRVQIAHGTWILDEVNKAAALHFSRNSLKTNSHFGSVSDIRGHIIKLERVYNVLLENLFAIIDYEPDEV